MTHSLKTKQTETREEQASLGLHPQWERLCTSGRSDLHSPPPRSSTPSCLAGLLLAQACPCCTGFIPATATA